MPNRVIFEMKQIAQHIKSGAMNIADVPPPAIGRGMILVKNYFSVISAGTENLRRFAEILAVAAREKSAR